MDTDGQDRTGELLAQLEAGTLALQDSERWTEYLAMSARFHRYSMGNVLLITLQCPHATQVAGFKTWLTMDRHVRKGEKGLRILAPMLYKRTETDPSTGEECERRGVRGFRSVCVFDVSQTDGTDLPTLVTLLDGQDVAGAFDLLARTVKGWGWTLADADDDRLGTANGMTCHDTREVLIHQDRSPLQRVKTLAHEMGHVLLHGERNGERGLVELEAESVAYVVCARLGIASDDYSFGYVAGWTGEHAQTLIRASAERIRGAVAQILTTDQVEECAA
jgi:antirestriction protein ArdC